MNKTVLVTGSSRGIGKAIALYLAGQGYSVVLHCLNNLIKVNEVVDQISQMGQRVRVLQFDLANRQECSDKLTQDIEAHGTYYGIVCNAGISADNAFPALTGQDWDSVIHTNLDGFYNVLHPLVMPMVRQRSSGRIITLSSVSGIMGNRGQVNYSAAKAGIIGATKALALELAKRNITVNCVAPGLIDTEMLSELPLEEIKKMIPLRRIGEANEIAATVAFLLSKEAGYITRQVISVNGGLC
ncbi:MAG: 3-oxoacyl-ACP reductase FabG [Methylococcales bacterium]|nr:3-oxoacyl-ACP reductase FabG [Methylococcales bacterium]